MNNGYKKNKVDRILKRKRRKAVQKLLFNGEGIKEDTKFAAIPYIPYLSQKIVKEISKHNVQAIEINRENLKKHLVNNKMETLDPLEKSGVYQVECENCDGKYIGQTGRNFKIRLNEHRKAVEKRTTGTGLSEHCVTTGHQLADIKPIRFAEKGRKLNLLEGLEIKRAIRKVDTTSQYDAVRAYLKELDIANNVWIGLSRTSDKRNFTWRDFRELSLTDYWQEAIPTGNDPLCAAMDPAADFRWHAFSCGGPAIAAFICELPVPTWATGSQGCLLTELPSLTVLYIPEQSAVELTSDCGLGGTKRIACKGNTDRDDMIRRLACDTSDVLDDKTQSPLPTTVNQDSTYTQTQVNTKTTKPWIWTSNTIDTGDYGLPTRHRRETEDTMSPSSTRSTTDFSTRITTEKNFKTDHIATESIAVTTITTEFGSTEGEPEATVTAEAEEFPSAINQGQLFSIIENGTLFDIIELNGTDENKTTTTETTSSPPSPLYTTVIYHKEPTEDAATTHYKISPTVVDAKTSTVKKPSPNELPSDNSLNKEVELFPIITNSLIKLNRTNRKELPISYGIAKLDDKINIDVDNNIQEEVEQMHKLVEIRIHHPGQDNTTKSTLFVTTRRNIDKTVEPKEGNGEQGETSRDYTTTESSTITETQSPTEESLAAEPTVKPNRQRQLTRPQRRSFYPYFFSRVLG